MKFEQKIEEEEEIQLDNYMRAITDFVGKNPNGTNENAIRNAMFERKICSPITTLKKIKRLLELGIIEDRKEGNGFHKYYLSDKSEFNRINKFLSRISKIINALDIPAFTDLNERNVEDPDFRVSHWIVYKGITINIIDRILSILCTQINNEEMSKVDTGVLSKKIINLILKVKQLEWAKDVDLPKALNIYDDNLEHMKQILSKKTEAQRKKIGLNVSVLDDLTSCVEDVRRDFQTSEKKISYYKKGILN